MVLAASSAAIFAVVLFVMLPPQGPSPPTFFEFLGRFHTLLVHLPVGVLLLVATAELLTRFPKLRERVDPALDLALPFLVATAVAAFTLGILLARGGGYPPKLVGLHRAFTFAAVLGTAGCLVAWTTRIGPDGNERRLPFRATLAATVLLLTVGAHFGGSLTHGDAYLTHFAPEFVQKMLGVQPPKPVEPVAADPGAEPLVFKDAIMPVLKRECIECHGPDKAKGGLRLDSLAAIMKGGDDGPVVVPGRGASSDLVKRLLLPTSDDDHMPPAEKPQSTSAEIDLFRWWIDRGANDTLKVRDAIVPDGARTILGATLGGAAPSPSTGPAAPPPSQAAVGVATMMPTASASSSSSASAAATPPAADGKLAYHDVIAPLLSNACSKCHGNGKAKGKLSIGSIASLTAGGKSGAGIVPGSASQGTVLSRLRLASDDDKHMPPAEEPQLSSGQVAMLAFWIAHGADEAMPASELPKGGTGLRRPDASHTPKTAPSTTAPTPPPASASAPVPPPAPAPAVHVEVGPGQVALYRDVVAPLLARRCGECHSGPHDEGGMRVDDLAKLVKDQDLVPGKPGSSPIVQRMSLPPSDDDHMPPKDKPQADAWEIAAVQAWVAAGAAADSVVAVSDLPASVVKGAGLVASPAVAPASSAATASATPPPGSVVPLRASGCGSCAVGSRVEGSAWGAGLALAFALGLATRRRRGSRA
jgi:hypothetical protein